MGRVLGQPHLLYCSSDVLEFCTHLRRGFCEALTRTQPTISDMIVGKRIVSDIIVLYRYTIRYHSVHLVTCSPEIPSGISH